MPTVVDSDHLDSDSAYYYAVIVIASFALFIHVCLISITCAVWNKRIVKLSQPFFTML